MIISSLSSIYKILIITSFSMLPIFEIRGAIPLAMSYGFDNWYAFIISYLGSILIIPIAFVVWSKAFEMSKNINFIESAMEKLSIKTLRKNKIVKKYNILGLAFFVAVPFPGTGIWSGVLLVHLLKMDIRKSLRALLVGNFIAGSLVLIASNGFRLLF